MNTSTSHDKNSSSQADLEKLYKECSISANTQITLIKILKKNLLSSNQKHKISVDDYFDYYENAKLSIPLFQHPLAALMIAAPEERFIHPKLVDSYYVVFRSDLLKYISEYPNNNPPKFKLVDDLRIPGYENGYTNDWLNSLLMIMYYVFPELIQNLSTHQCDKPNCIICLALFVFENIDTSLGYRFGQPVNARFFCDVCTNEMHFLKNKSEVSFPETIIPRGLLSQKLYSKAGINAKSLLFSDYFRSTSLNSNPGRNQGYSFFQKINDTRIIDKHEAEYDNALRKNRKQQFLLVSLALFNLLRSFYDMVVNTKSAKFDGHEKNKSLQRPSKNYMKSDIIRTEYCLATNTEISINISKLIIELNVDDVLPPSLPSLSSILSRCIQFTYSSFFQKVDINENGTVLFQDQNSNNSNYFKIDEVTLSQIEHLIEEELGIKKTTAEENAKLNLVADDLILSGPICGSTYENNNFSFKSQSFSTSSNLLGINFFLEMINKSINSTKKEYMKCTNCVNEKGGSHLISIKHEKLSDILCFTMKANRLALCERFENIHLLLKVYVLLKAQENPPTYLLNIVKRRIRDYSKAFVVPDKISFISKPQSEWKIVEGNLANSDHVYSLVGVLAFVNSSWNNDVRLVLEKLWQNNYHESKKDLKILSSIEADETTVERPTYEDQLVTYINFPNPDGSSGKWVLINGPCTTEVSEEEVRSFSKSYKFPLAFFYRKVTKLRFLEFSLVREPLFSSLKIKNNISFARNRIAHPPFVPLSDKEIELVASDKFCCALDSEYVVKSFDSKSPDHILGSYPQYFLARVTLLRTFFNQDANADPAVSPFLDVHINMPNQPVEYFTQYSGIEPGNLHVSYSNKWLYEYKDFYQYIRTLLHYNCIIIGHDLLNDFRVIGAIINPHLLLDTVEIYRLKNNMRFISLKFLAWFVLEKRIQDSAHNSFEDAKTSYDLYKYYFDFVLEHGSEAWEDFLQNYLYKKGLQLGFKAPEADSESEKQNLIF